MEKIKLNERELFESFEKYKTDLDNFGAINIKSPNLEDFQKLIPSDLDKELIE